MAGTVNQAWAALPPDYRRSLCVLAGVPARQAANVNPPASDRMWTLLEAVALLTCATHGTVPTCAACAQAARGAITSDAKAAAARLNGAKGGRPRKVSA